MRRSDWLVVAMIWVSFCNSSLTSQVEGQPSVVRAVPPIFPLPEGGPNAMGAVVMEVQIAASGQVVEVKAVRGHPALYPVAGKAARRWLFSPVEEQTKVRTVRLTFMFKFMDEGTPDEDLLPLFEPPYQIEVRRIIPTIETRNTKKPGAQP